MGYLAGEQAAHCETLELNVRSSALGIAARALEAAPNSDTRDYQGPAISCVCGAMARCAGRIARTIITVLGPLELQRAYYHCAACGHGFSPRDDALRIGSGSLSEGVLRMVGTTALLVSFAETEDLLRTLAAVKAGAKQVERALEPLGRDIDAAERAVVDAGKPVSTTMYLGIDGTGLPLRGSELAGRAGKQPGGTAKTREAKLMMVWSADGRDKDGHQCVPTGR